MQQRSEGRSEWVKFCAGDAQQRRLRWMLAVAGGVVAVCGLGWLAPWAKATYQASTTLAPSVQMDESDVEGLLRSARGGDYYQDKFDALTASIEASQTDMEFGNAGRGFNLALRRSLDGSRRWRMVPLAAVGETYLIADGYGTSSSSPDYDATSNFRNDDPRRLVLSTPDGTVAFYPSSVTVTEPIPGGRVTTANVEWESSGRWHASEVSTWTEYGVVFGDDSAATASLTTKITVTSNDGRSYQCDGELANNARPISDMTLPHIDCDTLSDAFGNQLLATYRKPDPTVPELEGSLWPVTLESLSDGKRQVRFSWTKLSESSYQGQIYLDANQNAVVDGDEPFVVYDYGYEPPFEEGQGAGRLTTLNQVSRGLGTGHATVRWQYAYIKGSTFYEASRYPEMCDDGDADACFDAQQAWGVDDDFLAEVTFPLGGRITYAYQSGVVPTPKLCVDRNGDGVGDEPPCYEPAPQLLSKSEWGGNDALVSKTGYAFAQALSDLISTDPPTWSPVPAWRGTAANITAATMDTATDLQTETYYVGPSTNDWQWGLPLASERVSPLETQTVRMSWAQGETYAKAPEGGSVYRPQPTEEVTTTTRSGRVMTQTKSHYDAYGHPLQVLERGDFERRTVLGYWVYPGNRLFDTRVSCRHVAYDSTPGDGALITESPCEQLIKDAAPGLSSEQTYTTRGLAYQRFEQGVLQETRSYEASGRLAELTQPPAGTTPARVTTWGYSDLVAGDAAAEAAIVETNALGLTTTTALDLYGHAVRVTDAQGRVTRTAIDPWGQQSAIDRPNSSATILPAAPGAPDSAITYVSTMEQPPRLVTITTGTYSKTVSLDDWGRLEELKDSRDQGLAFVYDASGRLRQKVGSLADKVASQATLDALGRVTRLDHYNAAGTTVLSTDTMSYDDAHLRTVSTDGEGRQETREYASWGAPDEAALIALTNPLGEVWMYGYEQDPAHGGNPYGQLSAIESPSDSALPQVQYTYNGQGLLASTVRADTGAVLYDYNTDGSVACVTDQDSTQTQTVRTLCYRYDVLNRVVNVEQVAPVAIASVQQIVYEDRYVDAATGEYTRVTRTDRGNGSSTVSHAETYDVAGRLHTATQQIQGTPAAYSTRVVFNTKGEQTELRYPTGLRVTTAYDAASRPLTVTAAKPGMRGTWTTVANVVTNVLYDDYHQIDSLSYGNKTRIEFDRDDKLRVSQYRVMNKDHYPQLHLQYTYNDADQITRITDLNSGNANRRTREYGYDAASRLTSELAIGLNRSVGYGYDSEHNVTTWTTADVNGSLGAEEALSYEQQQLTQIEHLDKDGLMLSTEALDYNAAGELMAVARSSLMASSSSLAYSRNGRGWLTGVMANGANSGTGYVYGPDGLRVAKTTPETATLYLRDPAGRILAELVKVNGSYQVQTETVYGPLGLAAQLSNNRATVHYLHTDQVGTVLAVTGSTSYATANYDYDAWGNLLASSGSEAANPAYRVYATAPYDPESGLYQMGQRYYDPRVGRFIEPDPIVDASQDRDLNRYTYAHGDPVNKSDPSGLMEGYANGDCFSSMDYYADCMQGLTEVPLLYKAAPAVAVASATGTAATVSPTAIENNGRLAVASQVDQKPRRLLQGGVLQEARMGPPTYTLIKLIEEAIGTLGDYFMSSSGEGSETPTNTPPAIAEEMTTPSEATPTLTEVELGRELISDFSRDHPPPTPLPDLSRYGLNSNYVQGQRALYNYQMDLWFRVTTHYIQSLHPEWEKPAIRGGYNYGGDRGYNYGGDRIECGPACEP